MIALKFTGFEKPFWSVFELEKMITPNKAGKADMSEVIPHDLSGTLLGNFSFQILAGTTIVMRISKDKVYSDGSFDGTIEDTYWETPDGRRVEPGTLPILHSLFTLFQDDVRIEDYPTYVIQKFSKVSNDAAFAYWCLPIAVDFPQYLTGGIKHWGKMLKDIRFSFTLSEMEQAVREAHKHNLAECIIHPRPQELPKFLRALGS